MATLQNGIYSSFQKISNDTWCSLVAGEVNCDCGGNGNGGGNGGNGGFVDIEIPEDNLIQLTPDQNSVTVKPTVPGSILKLPCASELEVGAIFNIFNSGDVDISIQNCEGNNIKSLSSGSIGSFVLTSKEPEKWIVSSGSVDDVEIGDDIPAPGDVLADSQILTQDSFNRYALNSNCIGTLGKVTKFNLHPDNTDEEFNAILDSAVNPTGQYNSNHGSYFDYEATGIIIKKCRERDNTYFFAIGNTIGSFETTSDGLVTNVQKMTMSDIPAGIFGAGLMTGDRFVIFYVNSYSTSGSNYVYQIYTKMIVGKDNYNTIEVVTTAQLIQLTVNPLSAVVLASNHDDRLYLFTGSDNYYKIFTLYAITFAIDRIGVAYDYNNLSCYPIWNMNNTKSANGLSSRNITVANILPIDDFSSSDGARTIKKAEILLIAFGFSDMSNIHMCVAGVPYEHVMANMLQAVVGATTVITGPTTNTYFSPMLKGVDTSRIFIAHDDLFFACPNWILRIRYDLSAAATGSNNSLLSASLITSKSIASDIFSPYGFYAEYKDGVLYAWGQTGSGKLVSNTYNIPKYETTEIVLNSSYTVELASAYSSFIPLSPFRFIVYRDSGFYIYTLDKTTCKVVNVVGLPKEIPVDVAQATNMIKSISIIVDKKNKSLLLCMFTGNTSANNADVKIQKMKYN